MSHRVTAQSVLCTDHVKQYKVWAQIERELYRVLLTIDLRVRAVASYRPILFDPYKEEGKIEEWNKEDEMGNVGDPTGEL